MKNRFITKKKKRRKIKPFFFFLMFLIGFFISYQSLSNSKMKINDKDFIQFITNNTFEKNDDSFVVKMINKTLEFSNPVRIMSNNCQEEVSNKSHGPPKEGNFTPVIYLYNSHQSEEYASSTFAEFSINPTVIMNNYIMEDIFNKNGFSTFVEKDSIKDILNQNNWNYSASYKASRTLMEKRFKEFPSLQYFIDIHRDSLKKDKTSISIDGKDYAKILFIIGMENSNYQGNLALTEKLHNKLNEKYSGISKGIYKKSGPGVNGIYNQDFSNKTILVEIGGYENTTTEVLNTSIAFANCFMEVIHE